MLFQRHASDVRLGKTRPGYKTMVLMYEKHQMPQPLFEPSSLTLTLHDIFTIIFHFVVDSL